jgi:2-polyprenyl-3-methyl-5-hydroxy-6-metoxy-1,4-benzoquinol methylase
VEVADRRSFAEMLALAEALRSGKGSMLDLGCNVGTCLAEARERGWDAQGLEINDAAAGFCRRERKLNVRTGVLDHDTYAPESFDLVMMADVVEHLVDPFETLRRVARALRPGGLVMISTPDIERWAARLLQVKPEEHLYYFSPTTIRTLLRQAGLETVRVQGYDRYHNLTAMVHSTTCGTLFQRLAPLFRAARLAFGDVVVKLPLSENLLAVGRKAA